MNRKPHDSDQQPDSSELAHHQPCVPRTVVLSIGFFRFIQRWLAGVGLVFALLSLSGCRTPDLNPGFVYRDWALRMSEMGIFPVYPPREDIVVGDVYALPLHPYDSTAVGWIGGLGSAGIHVGYLGDTQLNWTTLSGTFEKYYHSRPYAADTVSGGTNQIGPLTRIASYPYSDTNGTSAFAPGTTARLRQVMFPDFSVTTIRQGSLAGVVPIEGIMAAFNFSGSDIQAVHFKIPQAESYGITMEELLKEVYRDTNFVQTADGEIYFWGGDADAIISVGGAQMAKSMFGDVMEAMSHDTSRKMPSWVKAHISQSAARMKDKIYLALISEVYYARSIDVTIEHKTARGAGASARPISAAELGQLKQMGLLTMRSRTNQTSISTNSTTSTNSGAATITSTNLFVGTKTELLDVTEGDSAYDLASKLRAIETPDGAANVGGSVKVLSVSTKSVGLRRTFERPIVVGVRGVLVKVDVNNPKELSESLKWKAGDTNVAHWAVGPKWMKVEKSRH